MGTTRGKLSAIIGNVIKVSQRKSGGRSVVYANVKSSGHCVRLMLEQNFCSGQRKNFVYYMAKGRDRNSFAYRDFPTLKCKVQNAHRVK